MCWRSSPLPPGHELVEERVFADRHHFEARVSENFQANAAVGQEVDAAGPGGPARSLDTCGVVGTVTIGGLGSVDLIRPDDIGVTVPRCAERVDEVEIPPSFLDEDHVPERAPVMEHRRALLHVAGHSLDRPASPIIPATVARGVGVPHTGERYEEHQGGEDNEQDTPGDIAELQALRPLQQGSEACRYTQAEGQNSGDEEHVEVLDPELEVDGSLNEAPEEERAEENCRRAIRKEQVDGRQSPDNHQDEGELPEEMIPQQLQFGGWVR